MRGKNHSDMSSKTFAVGTTVVIVFVIVFAVGGIVLALRNQSEKNASSDLCFMGELCEHEDQESCEYCMGEMLEYVRPSIVQLYCEIEGGGYTAASGFIMEISEEEIYMCTNRHVIEGYQDWQIYFFDGTRVQGNVVGLGEGYDVAVVSAKVADVPEEIMQELQTVHIDIEYWKELGNAQFDVGLLRVDREGGILYTLFGQVLRVETDFPWGNGLMETELAIEQTAGDSGSALFDSHANLISMVHGNSEDIGGVRNWGIPLDGIVSSYEEITGRELK